MPIGSALDDQRSRRSTGSDAGASRRAPTARRRRVRATSRGRRRAGSRPSGRRAARAPRRPTAARCPRTTMRLIVQHAAAGDDHDGRVYRRTPTTHRDTDDPQQRADRACQALRRRRRLDLRPRNRRSAGAVTGMASASSPRDDASAPWPVVGGPPAPRPASAPSAADRSGAQRDDDVARPRQARRPRRPRRRAASTTCSGAAAVAADRLGERLDRHAGNRILAGGVDVGEHEFVGASRAPARTRSSSCRGARVAVRLERHDEPPAERGARGGEHGRDLGRVMAVVVDDQDAAGLAAHAGSGGRRRGTRRGPPAIRSNGTPSSRPTATAASAFCRLCRPGTAAAASPSGAGRGRRPRRRRRSAGAARRRSTPKPRRRDVGRRDSPRRAARGRR